MCAIFGSSKIKEFYELAELNSYRGTHSHSVSVIDLDNNLHIIEKGFGAITKRNLPNAKLYIGHQQAPTTTATDKESIHPSHAGYSGYLWHNGIIKESQMKRWQESMNVEEKWDTKLLQMMIETRGYPILSEADGSFACLHYWRRTLQMFRNDNCPLFIKGSSFSSTEFEGSKSIDSGVVYTYVGNDYNYLANASWVKTQKTFETTVDFYWSAT